MKHKKLLWGLLILCCLLFVRPAEGRAAEKVYTINITKTTPAAAEKKLRKMKAFSRQKVQFVVNVRDEKGYKNDTKKEKIADTDFFVLQGDIEKANHKLAKEKLRQWMKQFQKLKSNTYGVLPVSIRNSDVLLRDSSGIYKKYSYVSDYVNMNTICDKAYAATQGKCEYKGSYTDNFNVREQYSYLDINNKWITVDDTAPGLSLDISDLMESVPVRQYSKAELKKQSDSVRVQCLLYGVSRAKLFVTSDAPKEKLKQSLYDVARGKSVLRSENISTSTTNGSKMWSILAAHLSTDTYVATWNLNAILFPPFASICAKNASGSYDYYEVFDTTIQPENTSSQMYQRLKKLRVNWKGARPEYNWITKGKATEADAYYLKQFVKCFSDGRYIDYYASKSGLMTDQPIKLKITNNNKVKYGFTSASYTVNISYDENGQKSWTWTKN